MNEDGVSVLETGAERVTPTFSSAIKTLALLAELATIAGPIGVSDLARRTGSPGGTVHKRPATLVEAGLVEQDHTGRYGLSLLAARIGDAALAQAGLAARLQQQVLECLVSDTNETATLAAVNRNHALIVQRAESSKALNVAIRVGTMLPVAHSASVLVLQAFASPHQRADLRSARADLATEEQVLSVRAAGVVFSVDEFATGLSAASVPLRDDALNRVIAVMIVGPTIRFNAEAAHRALLCALDGCKRAGYMHRESILSSANIDIKG